MSTGIAVILYVLCAMGGVGLYLALPRPEASHAKAGLAVGCGAVAGLIALCVCNAAAPHASNGYFWFFATVALLAAGRVVTHPVPTYSAVYFALVVLSVAVLVVMQRAEFLAIALVIIYAGAILVTYAFVIMLAQPAGGAGPDLRSREPFLAVLVAFIVLGAIGGQVGELRRLPPASPGIKYAAADRQDAAAPAGATDAADAGNTLAVGRMMFGDYMVVVQLGGLLLLVAMVGAIAVSRKQVPIEEVGPPPAPPGSIGRQAPPF